MDNNNFLYIIVGQKINKTKIKLGREIKRFDWREGTN